jgi:hypothetical protein
MEANEPKNSCPKGEYKAFSKECKGKKIEQKPRTHYPMLSTRQHGNPPAEVFSI